MRDRLFTFIVGRKENREWTLSQMLQNDVDAERKRADEAEAERDKAKTERDEAKQQLKEALAELERIRAAQ